MASIQLIFKSGSIPVSDIGCSAQDRKSKGAEICTCPREVIEEALGTKGTVCVCGGVMFWFVPKELFFCFGWALRQHPGAISCVRWGT